MRYKLLIAFLFVSVIASGQDLESQKAAINAEVQRIDNVNKSTIDSFSIRALKKVAHLITYRCLKQEKELVKISRQFSRKNDTTLQTFYLKSGKLIYATEEITSYYTEGDKTDTTYWSGYFYFSGGKLIDYITLGHGKSEIESWDPEQGMLRAFKDSKADMVRRKK